jgi:hypothetical protein
MQTIGRAIAVSALALPLVFGTFGVAAADDISYEHSDKSPHHSTSQSVEAHNDGRADAHLQHSATGPQGSTGHKGSVGNDNDGNRTPEFDLQPRPQPQPFPPQPRPQPQPFPPQKPLN